MQTRAPRFPAPNAAKPHAPQSVEEVERTHMLAVLAAHPYGERSAAAELGISLRTLYYKINVYLQQGYLR